MQNSSPANKFPRISRILAQQSGIRPLETQGDIMQLVKSMGLLEAAIPSQARQTHKLMNSVSERMLTECTSGKDAKKITQAISSAVMTYSIVRDIYAGTFKALKETRDSKGDTKRTMMYESIVSSVRLPVAITESSDMKTVFSTIFKEVGEIRFEDFERVAQTLPDFDIFLPRKTLEQIQKRKLEQSAKRISF